MIRKPEQEHLTSSCMRGGRPVPWLCLVWLASGAMTVTPPTTFQANDFQDRTIVVGGDHDYPPYEFLDENGHPTGYNVELTRALARALGLDIRIQLGPWGEIRRALDQGEIDAIQGMFYSTERDTEVEFSPPHAAVSHVTVVRRGDLDPPEDVAGLQGKHLVVMEGDIMHDFALQHGLDLHLTAVPTQEDALRQLAAGHHDVALVARLPALYWTDQYHWNHLNVGKRSLLSPSYCYAVTHAGHTLLAELTEGLKILKQSGEYRRIQDRWLGVWGGQDAWGITVLRYAAAIIGILLLVVLTVSLWSWSLRRQVRARTADLRESHAAILDREARYRSLTEDLPALITTFERDGTLLFVNPALAAYAGAAPETLVGQNLFDLLPESNREIIRAKVARLTPENPVFSNDERHVGEQGQESLQQWTNRGFFDAEGRLTHVQAVGMDVTERHQLQEQLRHAEKLQAIGQLAGGVAHDFNNQLFGIIAFGELLQSKVTDPKRARWVDNILRAARRSSDLTQQLLAFARKSPMHVKAVDMHQVIHDVVAMLEHTIDRRIALCQHLEASPCVVKGDPNQLQNAILNLGLNARDAMPDGGQLQFSSDTVAADGLGKTDNASESWIRIQVKDTGCGMTPEIQQHMFEPFFTTKEAQQGTGMGLAAVYGTIKQHGGEIQVNSLPGKGTTFTLLLPLSRESVSQVPSRQPVVASDHARILVVDDEEVVRWGLVETLESLGYQTLEAGDGEEGVQRYREHRDTVDLVLMDMIMPKRDGRQALQAIREINPQARVMLISGYSVAEDPHEVSNMGFTGFIQKPVSRNALAKAVHDALQS